MTTDILPTLARFIAQKVLKQPGRQIAPAAPLISSGLVDSFSLVDLALFIEDSYGVRIEDTELNADSFDTLEQLEAIIRKRMAA